MYKWIRRGTAAVLVCSALLWGLNLWYGVSLPDRYYVSQGDDLVLTQRAVVAVENGSQEQAVMSSTRPQNQTLSLFGIMPIKTVAVQECEDLTVIPSGEAFGVKMFSQGAVVVGFSPVVTADGTQEPYLNCDIQEGDIICKVNEKEVTRNEEISYLIRESGGKPMELTLQREDEEHTVTLTPVLSSTDGTYKSGLWIRDSAAGIGTITFLNGDTGHLCRVGPPHHRCRYRHHPAGGVRGGLPGDHPLHHQRHCRGAGGAGRGVFLQHSFGRDSAEQSNRGVRYPHRYGFGRDGTGRVGV